MAALPKFKEPTPAERLHMEFSWQMNRALSLGLDEVIHNAFGSLQRDTAANVLYQTGVGQKEVEDAFDKAVRSAATGEPAETIGKHFAEYVRVATAYYVDITTECARDPSWHRWVSYEPRKEVSA